MKNKYVRLAHHNDIGEILRLCSKMHEEGLFNKISPDHTKMEFFIESCIKNDNSLILVSENNEKICGVFIASVNEYFFSHDTIANDYILYVSKENRNIKIVCALIRYYVEWAKRKNVKEICLSSTIGIQTDRVAKLYSRFGFCYVGHMFKYNNIN